MSNLSINQLNPADSNNISNDRIDQLITFLNNVFSYKSITTYQDRYIHKLIKYWTTPTCTAIPLCSLLKHPDLKEITIEDIELVANRLIHTTIDLEKQTIIIQLRLDRCTLILRDVPPDVTLHDILTVLSNGPNISIAMLSVSPEEIHYKPEVCPQVKDIRQQRLLDQCLWFITLSNSDLTFETALFLQQQQIKDMPIHVRIKNEMLLNIKDLIESVNPEEFMTQRRMKLKKNSVQRHERSYRDDKATFKDSTDINTNKSFFTKANFPNTFSKKKKNSKNHSNQHTQHTNKQVTSSIADEFHNLTDSLYLLQTSKLLSQRLRKKKLAFKLKKSSDLTQPSDSDLAKFISAKCLSINQTPTSISNEQSEKSDNRSTVDSADTDVEENINKKKNTDCVVLSTSDSNSDMSLLNGIRFGDMPIKV